MYVPGVGEAGDNPKC
jgi:hypothetical protein